MRPNALAIVVGLVVLTGSPGCARSPRGVGSGSSEPAGMTPREAEIAPAQIEPDSARTMFDGLEARLGRTPWRLRFELAAEGAVVASLAGMLTLDHEIELRATGRFAGAEQDLRLWTEGDRLRAGPRGAPTLDVPRPPELESALVIGMTRMGLLHNVAMLVGGRPPDHAGGGVREWVRTIEHARVDARGETGIGFVLEVAGERSGRGTLWLDARGLPVRRELTVEFPEGEMKVIERYEWLDPLPPAAA